MRDPEANKDVMGDFIRSLDVDAAPTPDSEYRQDYVNLSEENQQHPHHNSPITTQQSQENGLHGTDDENEPLTADQSHHSGAHCSPSRNVEGAEANAPCDISDAENNMSKQKLKGLKIFLLGMETSLIKKDKWLQFSEAIGYDMAAARRKIGLESKHFFKLLDEWMKVVIGQGINPLPYLHLALEKIDERELKHELGMKFGTGRPVEERCFNKLEELLTEADLDIPVKKKESRQTLNIKANTVQVGDGNQCFRTGAPDAAQNTDQANNNVPYCVPNTPATDGPSDNVFTEESKEIPVVSVQCPPRALIGDSCTINIDIKSGRAIDFLVWRKSVNGNYQVLHIENDRDRLKGGTTREPSLTIECVNKSDEGHYRCQAVTDTYTGHADFYLKVIGDKPKITVSTISPIQCRKTCRLECKVTSEIPVTDVCWFKNDKELALSLRHNGGTPSSPSLEIQNVDDRDTGEYKCKAVNAAGERWSNVIQLDVGDIPVITLPKMNYNITAGELVMIKCKVKSENVQHSITWFKIKNGDKVPVTNSSQFSGGTPDIASLTILKASEENTGYYVCCAENQFGKIDSGRVLLTVEKGNPEIQISVSDRALHGSPTTIKCHTKSKSPITQLCWHKNDTRLPVNTKKYLGGKAGSPHLTILNLSKNDEGRYICQALNEYGMGYSNGIDLAVAGESPDVQISVLNRAVCGSQITLICTVKSCSPITQLWWLKDEIRVTVNTKDYLGGQAGSPNLTIVKLRINDAGKYICRVQNEYGVGYSNTIDLAVVGEYPRFSIKKREVTCFAGEDVTMECQVQAEPAVSHCRWIRTGEGEQREMSTCSNANKCQMYNTSFTIHTAGQSDSGKYVCEATNEVGTIRSEDFVLNVQPKHKDHDMLILAAEEDGSNLEQFYADCQDNERYKKLEYKSFVMKSEITKTDLEDINNLVSTAKVVFMLISKTFTDKYWRPICDLENINSAVYNGQPLLVPVCLEQGIDFPMGLKSAQCLSFYRRDSYYKKALSKFIRQFSD